MLVVGVILLIVGAVVALYGVAQVATLISAFFSFENSITFMDAMYVWIIAGAVVAVVGIILMIAGKKKTVKS
jgi:hypothetical protein